MLTVALPWFCHRQYTMLPYWNELFRPPPPLHSFFAWGAHTVKCPISAPSTFNPLLNGAPLVYYIDLPFYLFSPPLLSFSLFPLFLFSPFLPFPFFILLFWRPFSDPGGPGPPKAPRIRPWWSRLLKPLWQVSPLYNRLFLETVNFLQDFNIYDFHVNYEI